MIAAVALDLGTTSIKAGLLDDSGTLRRVTTQAAPEITGVGGRRESDALAYAYTAERVLAGCLAGADGAPPLGLCSQRSSFLLWERSSGAPLTPLISWQDRRGSTSCDELAGASATIRELSGLRLAPYYFAPKLRALLRERPDWRAALESGGLMAGTLDAFLTWRWTGGKHHVTDASMAARTLLMDVRTQQWSPPLCELFGIPLAMLPRIVPSVGMQLQLDNGLALQASIGDQSAALVAAIAEPRREALVNLGTGGFVIRYLEQADSAPDGYLRTLVYQDSRARFAIEGTLNSLAAALAPYPVAECHIEDLARDDIFCLAEPGGIGAPYFRGDLGLHFSAPVEHLAPRAVARLLLEGIIFRVARILEDFHRMSAIERAYLSGGLSELPCLRQGIAQCAPCAVHRLLQRETSLQGAALLAAGMPPGSRRETERIAAANPALAQKYLRWKDWFDDLLG